MNFFKRNIFTVNKPENAHDFSCGHRETGYFDVFENTVSCLKNISATWDGICFTEYGNLVNESVHTYPEKLTLFDRIGRIKLKGKILRLENSEKYLIVHHPWHNYFHWLTESVPRLWTVRERMSDLTLLLPMPYRNQNFVQESLDFLNVSKVRYIESHTNLFIPNLVLPRIKPVSYSFNPTVMKEIINYFIKQAAIKKQVTQKVGKRVYILRGASQRRKIVNEDQVIQAIESFGIQAIDANQFSLTDQIGISRRLEFLMANGSGLTNMIFMKQGSCVLEVQKRKTNTNDFNDKALWHLAAVKDLNYYNVLADPVTKTDNMFRSDLLINIEDLNRNIQMALESASGHRL